MTEWTSFKPPTPAFGVTDPAFGDRIEIERGKGRYQHWALSLGGKDVMNFNSTGSGDTVVSIFITKDGKARIISQELQVVAGSSLFRINNGDDDRHFGSPGLPGGWPTRQKVLDNTSEFQELYPKYRLVRNNCECFVNYARYGERYSTQARNILRPFRATNK